jgi:uncharacterized protein (DUF1800 family)
MKVPLLTVLACSGMMAMAQTTTEAKKPLQQDPALMQDNANIPDAAQQKAARTFALKAQASKTAARPAVLTPLNPRERVEQLLERFTFGPKPGEVDHVLAAGADTWVNQQMDPGSVPDPSWNKRQGDFPTINMAVPQLLLTFPDRAQIGAVADGKAPYPSDPLQNAVYEVQVFKLTQERDKKKADGSTQARTEPTDAEKAAEKQQAQATATRIAGELFALPRQQRMAALIKMSVEDRIAFTGNGNLPGDQKNELFGEFTPREREAFTAMAAQVSSSYQIGNELAQARIVRDILTERQMQEVMTDFWFNHFNVFVQKDSDQWYTPGYERDVIRRNALGNFRNLLLATAESPAMMIYLDNWLSIGPDSLANGVDPRKPKAKKGNKGLNENYGREVMELHTVGVNGGYTQQDVTTLAAILTGWGVDQPNQGGGFKFDATRHEPGAKTWFGYTIDDAGDVTTAVKRAGAGATSGAVVGTPMDIATPDSMKQGIAALNILATSPKTAQFICSLLAQHFVADAPPQALVDRLAKAFLASHGDIKTVLRTLIASPDFNANQYFHTKVKTPVEFVASAFRTTATEPSNPGALVNQIRTMGMPMYFALPPTGYYLTADQWMNSSALVARLNFSYQLTNGKFANQKFDAPKLLADGLLNQPPAANTGAGNDLVLHTLEATMIGAPVSAQTNMLIDKQMAQQPAASTPTDTLNLLTALVMGSPEFQLR